MLGGVGTGRLLCWEEKGYVRLHGELHAVRGRDG